MKFEDFKTTADWIQYVGIQELSHIDNMLNFPPHAYLWLRYKLINLQEKHKVKKVTNNEKV